MPGAFELARKDLFNRNVMEARARHGAAQFAFWPEGYVLPRQADELRAAMHADAAVRLGGAALPTLVASRPLTPRCAIAVPHLWCSSTTAQRAGGS